MTAGFTVASGRVIWRTPGFYACEELTCPGEDDSGYSHAGQASAAGPTVGLRWVEAGHVIATLSNPTAPHFSADASVTIQGFSPRTGRTVWSFDAGRNLGLLEQISVPARIDANTIVVRDGAKGLVALDLRNGSHHPVSATALGWCEKTLLYHLSNASYYQGKSGLYVGQDSLFMCAANGQARTGTPKVTALVKSIGATAGGMTAWTDANTVRAEPG